MPLLVRLRPNVPYLLFVVIAAVAIGYGGMLGGPFGVGTAIAGGVLLVLFGYPVIASTICRVPVVVVRDDGIRLPLMRVRLSWPEISAVRRACGERGRLLLVPADPEDALRQTLPWLRREARTNMARHGTPIVLSDLSLDHSADDILGAVQRYRT